MNKNIISSAPEQKSKAGALGKICRQATFARGRLQLATCRRPANSHKLGATETHSCRSDRSISRPCCGPDCRRRRPNGWDFRNTISSAATTTPTRCRSRASSRRRRRCCGARADARHLWPRQRPAGLPPFARIPGGQAQARRRHHLHRRRDPDHLRLAAGARSGQRRAAGARRHRHYRAGHLSGRAQPADPARRQHGRHSARPRGHADGRAGGRARRPQAPRHPAQIHLHDPDRAEPDRHHHGRAAPPRALAAGGSPRRADLRGRLLRRPDLGRRASAGALRHEHARRRHPHRLVLQIDRAGAAGRLHRGRLGT